MHITSNMCIIIRSSRHIDASATAGFAGVRGASAPSLALTIPPLQSPDWLEPTDALTKKKIAYLSGCRQEHDRYYKL